jgi:hypothetical protein
VTCSLTTARRRALHSRFQEKSETSRDQMSLPFYSTRRTVCTSAWARASSRDCARQWPSTIFFTSCQVTCAPFVVRSGAQLTCVSIEGVM